MTAHANPTDQIAAIESGAVIDVPLNKLKSSPRNARRTPHSPATIEARAASIAAKGVLQPLVVEPEMTDDGVATGAWLVTIGEGRRLALRLLASRKRIKKTHLVRCVVDTLNDPLEISLDENVSRSDMHPADQFEAFRDLADAKGWGAEEIAARFGVTPAVVRQRLRLGAVSPRLMALYRGETLTLDQLMAFAVSDDHARQEQVLEQVGPDRPAWAIRRAMTETKVSAQDRRALFVGAEAYGAAGGAILRDLFTEDGGGWFEDVALLDRLVGDKLAALAETVREAEGWKWAQAHLDYPHAAGLARVYPRRVPRAEEEAAQMAALGEAYDALVEQWDAVEDLPPEVADRFAQIDAALQAFGDGTAYEAGEIARAGVFVILGHDGVARIERGFVRPEDAAVPEAEAADDDIEGDAEPHVGNDDADEAAQTETGGVLPDRLVLDLTAHRTLALRNALAGDPNAALAAVVHGLALFAFYAPYERASCLEIKATSTWLEGHAPGIADSVAGRAVADRHEAWVVRLPKAAGELWAFVGALGADDLLALLAHCASLTLNAVHTAFDRKLMAWAQADALAEALDLDMTAYWSPTVASYLGRVTKAKIGEAVAEGVSAQAATRIADLKKDEMAQAAETLLAGRGWLPKPLRRAGQGFEAAATDEAEAPETTGAAAAA